MGSLGFFWGECCWDVQWLWLLCAGKPNCAHLGSYWRSLMIWYNALTVSLSYSFQHFLICSCISLYISCSFFVVEDHILHTTQGLVNRAYVEELWELALSKTIAALRTHSVCLHTTCLTYTKQAELIIFMTSLEGWWLPSGVSDGFLGLWFSSTIRCVVTITWRYYSVLFCYIYNIH